MRLPLFPPLFARVLRQLTYCDGRYRRCSGSLAGSAYNQYAFSGACPLPLGHDRLATVSAAIIGLAALFFLPGCHLIFRYEDRPPDGGAPVLDLPLADSAESKDRGADAPEDKGPDKEPPLDKGPKPDQAASSWTLLKIPGVSSTIYGMWGFSAKEVYLALGNGSIVRYGGGTKFTTLSTANVYPLYAVAPLGSKEIIAVGHGGTVRICNRVTQLCSLADPPTGSDATDFSWSAVWCSVGGACYFGGFDKAEGGLFKRQGTSWTGLCGSLVTKQIQGVWGVSDNQVYAVGTDAKIFRISAATGCKVVHSASNMEYFTSVWANSTRVLAVGQAKNTSGSTSEAGGVLLVSGAPKNLVLSPHKILRSAFGAGSKAMILAGDKGTALLFDGSTVTDLKPPLVAGSKPHLWSAWMSGAGDIFVGGPGGVLLHYR